MPNPSLRGRRDSYTDGMLLSAMTFAESPTPAETFATAMAEARLLLRRPKPVARTWPTLLAALAFAVSALVFASAAILAPPVQLTPIHPVHAAA